MEAFIYYTKNIVSTLFVYVFAYALAMAPYVVLFFSVRFGMRNGFEPQTVIGVILGALLVTKELITYYEKR